jgi:hypothetical protein
MTALLDPADAKRLAKICGLFGSNHDGERAAAAAKADTLVRKRGLTWDDVFIPAPKARSNKKRWREPKTTEQKLALLRRNFDEFTDWERDFIIGVRGFAQFSEKQLATIDRLIEKVRDAHHARDHG